MSEYIAPAGDRLAVILALSGTAISVVLALVLFDNRKIAIATCLTLIFGLLIYPVIHFVAWFSKKPPRQMGFEIGLALLLLLIGEGLLGYRVWDSGVAQIRFLTYPVSNSLSTSNELIAASVNGVVSVDFTATAIGQVTAKNGALWVRICEACRFAGEPTIDCTNCASFTSSKDFPTDRTISFGQVFPNVLLPKMTVKITLPNTNVSTFDLAFFYACENCGSGNRQEVAVKVVPVH